MGAARVSRRWSAWGARSIGVEVPQRTVSPPTRNPVPGGVFLNTSVFASRPSDLACASRSWVKDLLSGWVPAVRCRCKKSAPREAAVFAICGFARVPDQGFRVQVEGGVLAANGLGGRFCGVGGGAGVGQDWAGMSEKSTVRRASGGRGKRVDRLVRRRLGSRKRAGTAIGVAGRAGKRAECSALRAAVKLICGSGTEIRSPHAA